MCGIFAASLVKTTQYDFSLALEAIDHRGPDGSGIYWSDDKHCFLGHKRLTIIDLTNNGSQPISDSLDRFALTFNGEIYNYRELKNDLEEKFGKIPWKSETDSEVIIEGVSRVGIEFLESLNGMYSLAIYDKTNRIMHTLRDQIGIKPLFVAQNKDGVFFCSELQGLLAVPGIDKSLRTAFFAEQLAYMYVPEPKTPFVYIQKMVPGLLQSYKDGILLGERKVRFKSKATQIPFKSDKDAILAINKKFSQAVRRQLNADVPVSVMLSGGLDSSAVLHFAHEHGASLQTCYTISTSSSDNQYDAQSDDLKYAKVVSRRYDADLDIIHAQEKLIDQLPRLIPYMGDGFCDPAAINTFLISQRAREDGVKVLLSGQGADEYLGGYRRYIAEYAFSRIPKTFLRIASRLHKILPESIPGKLNAFSRRVKKVLYLAGLPEVERLRSMYTWTQPHVIDDLLGAGASKKIESSFDQSFNSSLKNNPSRVEAMMDLDRSYDLLSLNLCYSDRMSMAAGVELRVPFLDLEFLETVNCVSENMKIKKGIGKYVLKKAMETKLPDNVIYRSKAGFSLPIRSWMRSSSELMDHYLCEDRLKHQGIFSHKLVNEMRSSLSNNSVDHSYTLFILLFQQIWLDHFAPEISLPKGR